MKVNAEHDLTAVTVLPDNCYFLYFLHYFRAAMGVQGNTAKSYGRHLKQTAAEQRKRDSEGILCKQDISAAHTVGLPAHTVGLALWERVPRHHICSLLLCKLYPVDRWFVANNPGSYHMTKAYILRLTALWFPCSIFLVQSSTYLVPVALLPL